MPKSLVVRLDDDTAAQLEALARLDGMAAVELAAVAVQSLVQGRRTSPEVRTTAAAVVAGFERLFGDGWCALAAANDRPPSAHPSQWRPEQPGCSVVGYL